MRWLGFAVLSLVIVGCSGSSTPATTPTSVATTSSTTTTTLEVATTTTVDRLTEIEAIYQDLEERRLDALYRGDEEAYRALFANEAYLEESAEVLNLVEFQENWPPVFVVVTEVLQDSARCIAARTATDYSAIFVGGGVGDSVEVIELVDGVWGISFVGSGWTCDGPHPLSP
jgi:hypothetical protein